MYNFLLINIYYYYYSINMMRGNLIKITTLIYSAKWRKSMDMQEGIDKGTIHYTLYTVHPVNNIPIRY